jgi:RNA polymerase sigma factor (sigma-70 family)
MNKEANMDDVELLREYVECQAEKAFAELVARHINLVYSTALRVVQEATLAEDVTQTVFIQLARKAATIRSGNSLPGWLYRVTRYQAVNALRKDCTRRRRETEAMNMTQTDAESSATWESLAPHLEDAMNTLSSADQNAVVLRFFQGRSWQDVGSALALNENTAQKRVSRAVDTLRTYFIRRGVAVSSVMVVTAIAANAVHAAPVGLASTMTTASLAGAAGAGTFDLLSTYIQTLLMKKTTCTLLVAALAAAVTIPIIVAKAGPSESDAPVTADSLRKGLVLHFAFDRAEPDGKVTDSSGSGNHGQVVGAKWTPGGKQGGAFQFAPPNQYIQVPNKASLNPSNITLAAWIKTSNRGDTWRRIIDKSWTNGYALSIGGGWTPGNTFQGRAVIEIAMFANHNNSIAASHTIVTDGQWHQVVTTYNGTEEVLYVDGVRQKQVARWKGKVPANSFDLTIGMNLANPTIEYGEEGASFDGLIDEPMIWNRALSEKEVAFLFQLQNGSVDTQTSAD